MYIIKDNVVISHVQKETVKNTEIYNRVSLNVHCLMLDKIGLQPTLKSTNFFLVNHIAVE